MTIRPAGRKKRVLVVWHSRTGGAEQMARAAAEAATAEAAGDVDTVLRAASSATATDVLDADAFLFVAPENLASLSGPMKDFFDRIYYDALDRIQGRPYALLVCAGSDGTGVVRQVERIATGLRLRRVAPATIVVTGAQDADAIWRPKRIAAHELERCREIGAALALGVAQGIF